MALISVIVPVYNVEPYLHRCVDSILAQTFRDFELILVDDGSPDGCGRICDDYAAKDSRVHVIHQKNGGLSAARNAGIDWVFTYSDSRWLNFVDSDDWVHSRYLECLLQAAEGMNCSVSACYAFSTQGEDFPEEQLPEAVCASADDYYCGDISGGVPVIACAKLYRRELFQSLYYPVGKLHEDEFTTYRAIYASEQVAVVPAALYAYYQNTAGIMRSKWNPRRMDAIEALDGQFAFAEQTGNARLKDHVFDIYTWFLLENLLQIRSLTGMEENVRLCRAELQQRLRDILHKGRNKGKYPLNMDNLWVYEEAYPAAGLWDILHRASRKIRKLLKR